MVSTVFKEPKVQKVLRGFLADAVKDGNEERVRILKKMCVGIGPDGGYDEPFRPRPKPDGEKMQLQIGHRYRMRDEERERIVLIDRNECGVMANQFYSFSGQEEGKNGSRWYYSGLGESSMVIGEKKRLDLIEDLGRPRGVGENLERSLEERWVKENSDFPWGGWKMVVGGK